MINSNLLLTILLSFFASFTLALYGRVAFKFMKIECNGIVIFEYIWVGYVITVSLISLINLFTGINYIVTLAILLSGLFLNLFIKGKNTDKLTYVLVSLVFLIVVISIANYFMVQNIYDDEGGYHIPILRLMNELPALKGIVNIHHRLASPYASIDFASFISFFPFAPRKILIKFPKIFLLSLILVQFLYATIRNLKTKEYLIAVYCISSVGLIFLYHKEFFYLGDLDVFILSFLIIYYLLRFIHVADDGKFFMVAMMCYGISISKMSASVFSVTALALAVLIYLKAKKNMKAIIKIFVLLVILFLPYVANNIVKSGTLLFPIEKTSLNVEWANPNQVKENRMSVTAWARNPGPRYLTSMKDNISWIAPWYRKNKKEVNYQLKLILVSLSLFFLTLPIRSKIRRSTLLFQFFIVYLPVIVSMISWFFTFPTIRFGGTFLGLSIGLPISFLLYYLSQTGIINRFIVVSSDKLRLSHERLVNCTAFFITIFFFTGLIHFFYPLLASAKFIEIPKASVAAYHTPKGKIIYYNTNKNNGNCYDTDKIPCGQHEYSVRHVEWIGTEISDGFKTTK